MILLKREKTDGIPHWLLDV